MTEDEASIPSSLLEQKSPEERRAEKVAESDCTRPKEKASKNSPDPPSSSQLSSIPLQLKNTLYGSAENIVDNYLPFTINTDSLISRRISRTERHHEDFPPKSQPWSPAEALTFDKIPGGSLLRASLLARGSIRVRAGIGFPQEALPTMEAPPS